MGLSRFAIIAFVLTGLTGAAAADTMTLRHGSDTFISGEQVNETLEAGGDAFLTGRTLRGRGAVAGDLHVVGFDVEIRPESATDLYAVGGTVIVGGMIDEDLSAGGFSVRTEPGTTVGRNARLFGNTVSVDGAIDGALLVTGRDVILNAAVAGDVRILSQSLSFGPDAKVGGALAYSGPEKVTVPDRVVPAERVTFERVSASGAMRDVTEITGEMPVFPTLASMVVSFLISLLFMIALGVLALTFMPNRLAHLRRNIVRAPGRMFLLGVVGLSMLFGMVPIIAMTIIGIPFVLFVLLLILLVWVLGYALGTYGVGMRVFGAFGGEAEPAMPVRLLVFAGALTFVALLNFIPFVGWVINFTLVLLGAGAMTAAVFNRFITSPDGALDTDMAPQAE